MKTVEKNKIVYLTLKVTTCDFLIEDTSETEDFVYLHGYNNIIPKLESFIGGKQVGYEGSVDVEAKDAFGEYIDDLVISVTEDTISSDVDVCVGSQVQFNGPEGVVDLYIREVGESELLLDANHPFAGYTVNYDIKINRIEDAHKDEIKHGKVNPITHNIMMEDSSYIES